jgi:hypothetical protein
VHETITAEPRLGMLQNPTKVDPSTLVQFQQWPVVGWHQRGQRYWPAIPIDTKGVNVFRDLKGVNLPSITGDPDNHRLHFYRLLDRATGQVFQSTGWMQLADWEAEVHRRIAVVWQWMNHREASIKSEELFNERQPAGIEMHGRREGVLDA